MDERLAALEAELACVRAERDALVEALRSGQRFQATVDGAPLAIMCVSGVSGRYVFANRAYAALLGRELDELLQCDPYQVWLDVTHPDDLDVEREAIERVARGEIDGFRLEKRLKTGSGESRWVRADIVASRDATGRLECLTAYFTDIHEQRALALARDRLEAQLRRAQKLEALGKLAGGVAHDFNNRLVIIMGYTELMKRGLPAESPLVHHADMVLMSAQRAAELTRQLLAYSRRQVLKPEAFSLRQAVERLRFMLERLLGDRTQLSTAFSDIHSVFSDPSQIEQVLLNLVINARDAMPEGGQVTLETRDVILRTGEEPPLAAGDYVALLVSDTGTGIPDSVLPHIFEPFFTTKELGQGSGLGLSMVEGIVHQSGGAVKVRTRVGEGTSFIVYLPRGQGPAQETRYSAEPVPPRDLRVETVLVCDDDDDVRKLLIDLLGFRAYRVLEARNGRQALERVRAHQGPIHLLVTDLVMPELGGVELAAQLRQRDPGLRVLYVSGYAQNVELLSEPLGPTTHFLAKPFLPGDLHARGVFPFGGQPALAQAEARVGRPRVEPHVVGRRRQALPALRVLVGSLALVVLQGLVQLAVMHHERALRVIIVVRLGHDACEFRARDLQHVQLEVSRLTAKHPGIPTSTPRVLCLVPVRLSARRGLGRGYANGKAGPLTGVARGADGAAMRLDDATHHREPQTHAARGPSSAAIAAKEGLEDPLQVFRRDAHAAIPNTDHERGRVFGTRPEQLDLRPRLGELGRVVQ